MPRGHPGYTVHRASRALPLVLALGHREPTHPEAPRADPPARSLHPRIQRLRSILLPRVFGRCETVVPEWPHAALLDRMARWSDRRFSTLFLHDRAGTGFYGGVAGLGDTIDEVSTALQALIAKLEPSAILAVGEGLGGHAPRWCSASLARCPAHRRVRTRCASDRRRAGRGYPPTTVAGTACSAPSSTPQDGAPLRCPGPDRAHRLLRTGLYPVRLAARWGRGRRAPEHRSRPLAGPLRPGAAPAVP